VKTGRTLSWACGLFSFGGIPLLLRGAASENAFGTSLHAWRPVANGEHSCENAMLDLRSEPIRALTGLGREACQPIKENLRRTC
jgi:hypothetical protein